MKLTNVQGPLVRSREGAQKDEAEPGDLLFAADKNFGGKFRCLQRGFCAHFVLNGHRKVAVFLFWRGEYK